VILGLTADAQQQEIERCLQAGMDECTVKPMGLDALKGRLQALSARRAEVGPASDVAGTAAGIAPAPAAAEFSPPGTDLDVLLMLTGGDVDKARNLAREVVKSVAEAHSQLRRLTSEDSLSDIAVLAHQILGVARVLSNEPLARVCLRLESACLQRQPGDVEVLAVSGELGGMLGEMHARYSRQLDAVSRYRIWPKVAQQPRNKRHQPADAGKAPLA